MIVEGTGRQAPASVGIHLNESDARIVVNASIRRATYRGYANSASAWKQGFIGDKHIHGIGRLTGPEATIFIGLACEAAFILFANKRLGTSLSLNDRLMVSGDGGTDIEIYGLPIQIKARDPDSHSARCGVTCVRFAKADGTDEWPSAPVIVFGETFIEGRMVSLLGWEHTVRLKSRLSIVPARKGDHTNIEVPDLELLPMSALVDRLQAKKELQ